MSDDETIPEKLDEKYRDVWREEPVNTEIVRIYYKELDGFFVDTGDEGVGLHPEHGDVVVAFFKIEDGEAVCTDKRVVGVTERLKNRMTEMMENTATRNKMIDGGDMEDEDDERLGYFG